MKIEANPKEGYYVIPGERGGYMRDLMPGEKYRSFRTVSDNIKKTQPKNIPNTSPSKEQKLSFRKIMKIDWNLQKVAIIITCIFICTYLGINIYKELVPKSYKEEQMHCLELGSDSARAACLRIIKK